MKRIILICALIVLPFIANAQLNVTKVSDQIETIDSARAGNISLKRQGDMIYLAIMSNNQFDDPQIFYLGESKESAISTLTDMMDLLKTMGTSVVDVDNNGMKVSLYRLTGMSMGINFHRGAGTYWIATNEGKRFINALK